MPIVTEFSARFVAAGQREIGAKARQRKMSSLAALTFASTPISAPRNLVTTSSGAPRVFRGLLR